MTFDIEAISQTEFRIYENAVMTLTGGTPTTPMNNNRNSTNTSVMTVYKTPSINTTGSLIYSQSSGYAGVTLQNAKEGIVSRNKEIILKQNSDYIFRITSKDDDNIINYCGEWYEHADKS